MRRHVISTMVGLGLLCASVMPEGASGAVINVPTDQPTIQAAVDAAINGDTVAISAGVYSGPGNRDVDFGGKRIMVTGASAATTIVDCGGSSSEHHGGFVFRSTEDSTSVLAELTIRHAWRPLPYSDSGAIDIRGSAAPTILRCSITDNTSNGVIVTHHASPNLIELTVSRNDGWGIWMPGYPAYSNGITVRQCQVDHNALGGVRITMAMADRPNQIVQNTIVENKQYGLFLEGEPPLEAAVLLDTGTFIEQNIIAFNSGMGILRGCCWFPGLHFYRNNVYGNTKGSFNGLGIQPDSVCMISVDPLFCRDQGGGNLYTLGAQSPCLAANSPCGVGMGAFAEGCSSCCVGYRGNINCDPFHLVDISDLTRFIDYGYISFEPLCCYEGANMDGEGGIDISDLTVLIDYLYISFTPPPQCP